MKHSYNPTCECIRCRREHGRRNQQAKAEHARQWAAGCWPRKVRRRRRQSGLERWARTYLDTEGGIDQFNPDDR
jgi:hypothetical protein